MKDMILLSEAGPYYKANLHCHTVISDGKLTKEEVKAGYQERGYSIVAFTDHDRYRWHKELTDENFLALAGYEVELDEKHRTPDEPCFGHRTYHMNLFDTDPTVNQEQKQKSILPTMDYSDLPAINQFIADRTEDGFLVCYNHPYWSLQSLEDYKDLKGLFAMEIYNHGCEHDGLYGYHGQAYDEMLRNGQRIYCMATDDNHDAYPFDHPLCDSFGGFVYIQAEKLEYQSVIQALKEGRFYWSQGPQILGVSLKDNKLTVKTSPVEKIFIKQEGRDTHKALAPLGETITGGEFELNGNEGYIRVEIRDAKGLHAGTRAYFLDELK